MAGHKAALVGLADLVALAGSLDFPISAGSLDSVALVNLVVKKAQLPPKP